LSCQNIIPQNIHEIEISILIIRFGKEKKKKKNHNNNRNNQIITAGNSPKKNLPLC